jgi:RNA polymerase sigma factor (sigma-70 family)
VREDLIPKLGRMFKGGPDAWDAYKNAPTPHLKRKALNRIVELNTPYIAKCVRSLAERGLASPLSANIDLAFDDLLQAGRRGYVKAIERFDPELGALPDFSKSWIRNEVQRTAAKDATIHKPEQIRLPMAAIRRGEAATARHGQEPTADEMGVTEKQLADWKCQPVVLPAVVKSGKARDLGAPDLADDYSNTPDPSAGPEELCARGELRERVQGLPATERRVLTMLFWDDLTIEQVAKAMKIPLVAAMAVRDAALMALGEDED